MSASTVTASTMAKFMKGLIGQGTVTDGADSPLKNPKNPPTDKLVDSDVESGGGDGANDNETRQVQQRDYFSSDSCLRFLRKLSVGCFFFWIVILAILAALFHWLWPEHVF